MKPYGVKRNWNESDVYLKNGEAQSRGLHRKFQKLAHRKERRTTKNQLKKRQND